MSKLRLWFTYLLLAIACACILAFALPSIRAAQAQQDGVFTVDSTLDIHDAIAGDGACATVDGACTLRAAIMESNALAGANVINLPAGTYVLTIAGRLDDTGSFGDLDITDDLQLIGASAEETIIDGDNLDRVLHFPDETTTVLIEKLTIQNGNTETEFPGGAGIFNKGTLTIRDTVIRQNRTDPDDIETRGGGVRHDGGFNGTLLIEDSIIEENQGQGVYTWFGRMSAKRVIVRNNNGEGIVKSNGASTFELADSLIVGNTKRGIVAGDVYITDTTVEGNGGGMQIGSGTVVRVTIRENVTEENGAGIWGGGITVIDSIIENNHSTGPEGGGGIYSGGYSRSALSITNSSIVSNTATSGGGVNIAPSNLSGASNQIPRIDQTVISGNSASQGGGGISSTDNLYVHNSTISNNQAGTNGGGILAETFSADNSTISNNQAGTNGGGIYTGLLSSESMAILSNLTIFENKALNGTGGFHNNLGLATIRNSIIAANQSMGTGSNDCTTQRPIISEGHNLIQDIAGCTMAGDTDTDSTNVDPMLGPLQDNGGATFTHALIADSPAVDAGPSSGCANAAGTIALQEQRGFLRAVDGNGDGVSVCDIGAYEFGDGTPIETFVPIISSASTSSATLSQPPSNVQLATTFGTLGAGLALSLVMVFGLSAVQIKEEDQDDGAEGLDVFPSLD